jgi:hypothetical protein
MIFLAILSGLLAALFLVMLFVGLSFLPPGKTKLWQELERMKAALSKRHPELTPIGRHELEIISNGQQKHKIRRWLSTSAEGVYTTIFNEPVAAYSYKQFPGKKNSSILFVKTAEHEYAYLNRKNETRLYIDQQEVGYISQQGVLTGKRTGKVLAQLAPPKGQLLPVKVGEREIGSINQKAATGVKGLSERAFEFLLPDISEKEEQLFLAISLREMIGKVLRP